MADLEKEYQESVKQKDGDAASKSKPALSQIGSVAKSKAKSKATTAITSLSKIPEEMSNQQKTISIDRIKQYMRKLQASDRECFEKLLNVLKFAYNNKLDTDKFLTIKVAVAEFKKSNGRRMAIEELTDFCKLEFEDFKFIDILVQYCKDPETGEEAHNK